MVISQPLQHVALGMIGSPDADAFRQRGCHHTGFYTQAEPLWVDRRRVRHQRFIEPTPDGHRAKRSGSRGAVLPSSTIGLSLQSEARWHHCRSFRFHVVQPPGHNPATNLLEKGAQGSLKRRHLWGVDSW